MEMPEWNWLFYVTWTSRLFFNGRIPREWEGKEDRKSGVRRSCTIYVLCQSSLLRITASYIHIVALGLITIVLQGRRSWVLRMKSQLPRGPGSRALLALPSIFLILDEELCFFFIHQSLREKTPRPWPQAKTSSTKHVPSFRYISGPQGKPWKNLVPNNSIFLLQLSNNSKNDGNTFLRVSYIHITFSPNSLDGHSVHMSTFP